MKRMLLVINPKSGRGEIVRKLFDVVDLFSRAGYEVEVFPTTTSGDARSRIQDAGSGFGLIVCAGGDGMMNEAVNAYMNIKNPPHLAYIPCGTTNDFAIALKLPRDIIKSARSILNGHLRMIDIGSLGDTYFSYVAAFGLFTNVPYSTDQNAKNILGGTAYFLEGIKHLKSIPSIDCIINADDKMIEGNFMLGIIANTTSIAGFQFNVEKGTAFDDGLFEVILISRPKNFQELQEIIGILQGSKKKSGLVIKTTAKRIEFTFTHPCDWTADGEYGGQYKTVTVRNLHRMLKIVMPPAPSQK